MISETGRLRLAGHLLGAPSDVAKAPSLLPITRATALRRWRAAILTIGTVEFLVILLRVLHEPTPTPAFGERVFTLVEALAVPVLLILTTSCAERHLWGRPPKTLLATQLAFFALGTTLAIAAATVSQVPEILGLALEGLALLLGVAWFVGVSVVSPVANEA